MAEEEKVSERAKVKKKKKKKKIEKSISVLPWKFPKNSIEDAIKVVKALEEKFAGNPTKADYLVRAVGFNKSNDWRFLDLLKSGNLYGITSGSGATAIVRLEKLGEDIVSPSSPDQRQKALLEAFRNVEDFRRVEEFYKGKKIPEDEFFENTLIRNFNIPRDRVKTFAEVFLTNLDFLRAFRASGEDLTKEGKPTATVVDAEPSISKEGKSRIREFLDTCFVMMPLGDWFDSYYKDVYVPAIKEAGFEPVRADELFGGTVVEQIWDQINKSKVLLADLSGKNANVFYELGLAHAAKKPVVFTSGKLEDVPFDLRHLRVIVYEVREPDWNLKLKRSITSFLKNARSEPEKSTPQPFRDQVE